MIKQIILCLCLAQYVFLMPTQDYVDPYENPEIDPDLFEGDIMGIDETNQKGLAQQLSTTRQLWSFGIVPYTFTAGAYNSTQMDKIKEGMQMVENATRSTAGVDCIKFVPYTNQANWIRFLNGTGCSSNVGRNYYSGEQIVNLKKPTTGSTSTCLITGIIAHELLHAIGFWHEQSRPDRDNYVTVNWQNIQVGHEHNFNKYTSGVDLLGFPYDYDSLMHYDETSFALSGTKTIVPKISGVTIGQRKGLSSQDVAEIRKYYNCK